MAEEAIAFSTISPPVSSEDEHYEALHAAVAEMPHGRWFLEEYARRHRAADTQLLLDTIGRLERSLSTRESGETAPEIYAQLLDTAKTIAQARAQIEGSLGAFISKSDSEYRAQMLAALVADLECRISSMLQLAAHACETSTRETHEGTEFDIDRGVPCDEPLDNAEFGRTGNTGGESVDSKMEGASSSENQKTMQAFAIASAHARALLRPAGGLGRPMPRMASNDPLAPIKAMTDEERIALFT